MGKLAIGGSVGEQREQVPLSVRVRLVHGYVQLVADEVGVDVLHIKGPALHPRLVGGERGSVDTDVLVRPTQVRRFVHALLERGWRILVGFDEGSAFGHAMNLGHDMGGLDLHRQWPGFGASPDRVFDRLWQDRETALIAGVRCTVPSLLAQRVILVSHYGRSGGSRPEDLELAWVGCSEAEQLAIRDLVAELEGEVSLAAATGELDQLRQAPEYRLWRYFSRGSTSRVEEWAGRWNAARGPVAKTRVIIHFLRLNRDLLAVELGRTPTRRDLRAARRRRAATALVSLRQYARDGFRRCGE